ncbi:MAG TPA: superoxide dismutase [Caulobacteraceae bacterium]|jgi:Fe-Mn family superoxide dismutase|nr:superoxide dismutase [Caulobacteraceae bacterium]
MFVLPALPYAYDALQPVISERTMQFHHDKHHKAYVDTTNTLLANAATPDSLEAAIREARSSGNKKLFNNTAQAWNHAFFWVAMAPGAAKPAGDLAQAITGAFGDLAGLKQKFVEEGVGHFGSGWVWLVANREHKLEVQSTHDAEDMVTQPGLTPLIVCDLWEHAYYLDHQNNRKGYLEAWFDQLANWAFAGEQLSAAQNRRDTWRYPAPTNAKQAAGA